MAKITTQRFSIPRNPNLTSPSPFEVANNIPWFKDANGRTIANQLAVARQRTVRPQSDALGEVARMWVAPMSAGFLLTAAKPENPPSSSPARLWRVMSSMPAAGDIGHPASTLRGAVDPVEDDDGGGDCIEHCGDWQVGQTEWCR